MKYSRQRERLLELLRSTTTHPSADILYNDMRNEFPNISLATIYRNLIKLEEMGYIMRVPSNDDKDHFDGTVDDHSHFVCRACGVILDVDIRENSDVNKKVEESLGVVIDGRKLTFYGLCKNCKECNN